MKNERERLGLNQTEFSAFGGVSKVSQFNYETDKRSPDAVYLAAVAAIGVDVLYVLTGQRAAPQQSTLGADETVLVEKYRRLAPENKVHAQAVVGAFADKGDCGKEVK